MKILFTNIGRRNYLIDFTKSLIGTQIYVSDSDKYASAVLEKNIVFQQEYPESIILTSDTIVSVGRRILPKTMDINTAEECLKLISGRRHKVFTSFTIYTPNNSLKTKTIQSIIKFKRLHPDEIRYYLATKEWEGKAGGYAIQGIAASFINFISGSYSNVVGLPLAELYRVLISLGYNFKND